MNQHHNQGNAYKGKHLSGDGWHTEVCSTTQLINQVIELKLIHLYAPLWWFKYAWPIESDFIRRCGLVGVGP